MPSLQQRLGWLIETIAGDIFDLETNEEKALGTPRVVATGAAFQVGLTSTAGSYYLSSSDARGPLLVSSDTQGEPFGIYFDLAEWDIVPGYKPQFRIRGSHHSQTTDPGTQTFTCALTNLVQTTGAGANNSRWSVSGTYSAFDTVNIAANAVNVEAGAWADMVSGLYGVYHHASVAIAANAVLSTLWQLEVRYVKEVPIP